MKTTFCSDLLNETLNISVKFRILGDEYRSHEDSYLLIQKSIWSRNSRIQGKLYKSEIRYAVK